MGISKYFFRTVTRIVSRQKDVSVEESIEFETHTDGSLLKTEIANIIDGDTIDVHTPDGKERVRLEAIDCPEDGQHWGSEATLGLLNLIGGRTIYIEYRTIDSYNRWIATIYTMIDHELVNVNERMVMQGHAWVMRRYYKQLSKSRQIQLNQIEDWAKSKGVGLWGYEDPIPPWEWRNEEE